MRKSLLVLLLLLTACIDLSGSIVIDLNPPKETIAEPRIFFCPRDNCADELLVRIENSQNTVDCALFDLDIPELIEAFIKKSKIAKVRLVIDDHNVGKLDKWYFIRKDTSSQLSHNKFCVFDDSAVWTGSFNPTYRGNSTNNNNALYIQSPSLAVNYAEEFQELWEGEYGKGGYSVTYPEIYINSKLYENYFCPEDSCAYHINKILDSAEESIYFMTFSFTHDILGDTIIAKHQEGVTVQGVFEKSQNNAYVEKPKFEDAGIDVKFDLNKANMHHKVFIIDEKIVITGSMNPSKNGDEKNDENVLIIHDEEIAQLYMNEFQNVWG